MTPYLLPFPVLLSIGLCTTQPIAAQPGVAQPIAAQPSVAKTDSSHYFVVRLRGNTDTLRKAYGLTSFRYPLYQVTDSTVSVLRTRTPRPQSEVLTVPVRLLDGLRIQRNHQRGGAGRGAVIGMLLFGLGGLISGDDYFVSAGEKALVLAPIGALLGVSIGALASSNSLKISLNRRRAKLAAERQALQRFTLSPQ